jgi:uncharacterized protein (TIGR02452 family)
MYDFHRSLGGGMYTSYALYSPDVPVFRTDDGDLLEQPYPCAFITAPAVNAKVVLGREASRHPAVFAALEERVYKCWRLPRLTDTMRSCSVPGAAVSSAMIRVKSQSYSVGN